MPVIIRNVPFYTSIPNPKSGIVLGMTGDFVGTGPLVDTDTYAGFCVSIT